MIERTVIYEAIIVGIYFEILFRIVTGIVKNTSVFTLFVVGFLKHFLGYYLQLQSAYCYFHGKGKAHITYNFINECILEGFVFTILYSLLPNAFIIGIFLHLISEYIGIHKVYIKYRCQRQP